MSTEQLTTRGPGARKVDGEKAARRFKMFLEDSPRVSEKAEAERFYENYAGIVFAEHYLARVPNPSTRVSDGLTWLARYQGPLSQVLPVVKVVLESRGKMIISRVNTQYK